MFLKYINKNNHVRGQPCKRIITQTQRATPLQKVANHQKIQADFETRESDGQNPL